MMMKKKGMRVILALCMMLVLTISITGCGDDKTKQALSKNHDVVKSIGTATNDLNAYKVKVQNKTGEKITSVKISNSISNDYGDNLLDSDDTFNKDEVRYMYYDATDAVNTAQEKGKKESSIKYYVKLTLDSGSTYVISDFPFTKLKGTAKIYFDSKKDVCYLIYTTKAGKKINTKNKEKKSGVTIKTKSSSSSDESSSTSSSSSSSGSSSSYSNGTTNRNSGRYGVGGSASNNNYNGNYNGAGNGNNGNNNGAGNGNNGNNNGAGNGNNGNNNNGGDNNPPSGTTGNTTSTGGPAGETQ
ncbi:hypothetical protein [Pseudoramibacter sp.]|jgi:hypothetical protein|uniref:hypothetical protein n=1 Tax=Pseudoramibacter sp. TaxID=2034862 RepID=UPI0025D85F45|nr:hypothetical protein [Pseudoramibacter sp.]MCH4072742.1 hypothetical protein [Pseudoramibacter sp.]MCH4106513.1 hypothetical protein [Pseudoramibacter sp.]